MKVFPHARQILSAAVALGLPHLRQNLESSMYVFPQKSHLLSTLRKLFNSLRVITPSWLRSIVSNKDVPIAVLDSPTVVPTAGCTVMAGAAMATGSIKRGVAVITVPSRGLCTFKLRGVCTFKVLA